MFPLNFIGKFFIWVLQLLKILKIVGIIYSVTKVVQIFLRMAKLPITAWSHTAECDL